jgi:hypothetical protein
LVDAGGFGQKRTAVAGEVGRGWTPVRLSSDNGHLTQEAQLLREELRIKDARLAKIDPTTALIDRCNYRTKSARSSVDQHSGFNRHLRSQPFHATPRISRLTLPGWSFRDGQVSRLDNPPFTAYELAHLSGIGADYAT